MPNWVTLTSEAYGDCLINLDSGMVVQSVKLNLNESETKIWSLHGRKRSILGPEKLFKQIEGLVVCKPVDRHSEINDIHWTQRVSNCFHLHGMKRINDLLNKTEADLLKMRCFGVGSLDEVVRNLAYHNLALSE
jgi:hypothetical protein